MYFDNCQTSEELKKEFKRLCMKWHPDRCHEPNATAIMQAINAEFTAAFDRLKNCHANANGERYTTEKETSETAEQFREIIEKLLNLSGVKIEICGSWIWCSGNTREHKDTLKKLGFYWSKNKLAWYYHNDDYQKKSGKILTLNEIRSLYGSEEVSAKQEKRLHA